MAQNSLVGVAESLVRGKRRLLDQFSFRLESPLLSKDVGFETAGEIKISTETIAYRAGGSLVPVKNPGLSNHPPFTAQRAATMGVFDLYHWKTLVTDSGIGVLVNGGLHIQGAGGCNPAQYKCYIDVVHTDRCHRVLKRWRLFNCWPTEYSPAAGFDNNTSDHVRENITWEYDFFAIREKGSGLKVQIAVYGDVLGVPLGITLDNNGLNIG